MPQGRGLVGGDKVWPISFFLTLRLRSTGCNLLISSQGEVGLFPISHRRHAPIAQKYFQKIALPCNRTPPPYIIFARYLTVPPGPRGPSSRGSSGRCASEALPAPVTMIA
jgi:hypothetical protein